MTLEEALQQYGEEIAALRPQAAGEVHGRYAMKAEGKSGTIEIMGAIGSWWEGLSLSDFKRELKELGDVDEINVVLNSEGGMIFDGIAIHNMLVRHKARVVVDIIGLAGSIASVVAMAGDEVRIASNGFFMIHNPMVMVMAGKSDELRRHADLLDKLKSGLVASYMRHTNLSEEEVSAAMDEETWYTAEEAVKAGFASEVVEAAPIAAFAGLTPGLFAARVPKALAAHTAPAKGPQSQQPPQKEDEMDEKQLQEMLAGAVQAAVAPLTEQLGALQGEVVKAREESQAAHAAATAGVVSARRGGLTDRLEALVASGRVEPSERDAYAVLLADDATLGTAESFIAALEKTPAKRRSAGLTAEVATQDGKRRVVAIDRSITGPPKGDGTPGMMPDASMLAIHQEALANAGGDHEKYRRAVYEAMGEPLALGTDETEN